jgi:hypothetical protein
MRNGWVVQGVAGRSALIITKAQIDDLRSRMFQKEAADHLGVEVHLLRRRFAQFSPGGTKWWTGNNFAGSGRDFAERARQHSELVALHRVLEDRIAEVSH